LGICYGPQDSHPVEGVIMSLKINIAARNHLTKRFHESCIPHPVDPSYLEVAQSIAASMIDEITIELSKDND
jgi:hypothetical protein